MKRIIGIIAAFASAALLLTGCSFFARKVPSNWYAETVEYYESGFESDWKNERVNLFVSDEMKEDDEKFGYLLNDLDGDGTFELLIGIMDDAPETKFIDVYIWHKDKGSFRIIHSGDGYYTYLCEDGILRNDSWYGSEVKTEYLKFIPENNSFLKLNETAAPQKWELTAF